MSSMDCEIAKVQFKSHHNHDRHNTMATSPVPTYVNRSAPTYSITAQDPASHGNSLASPRYSPNVQPWRRQQAQSSLSFIPSTSPRSEQSEYTTSQLKHSKDRGAACVSPFRSVRRMKEPFQLRLPASPTSENNPSFSKESRVTPVPSQTRTLRTWRSDQNLVSSSLETFGLLPSPPLSDTRASQPSPSSTYFSLKAGSELDNDQDQSKECICFPGAQSCGICDPRSHATEVDDRNNSFRTTNVHMAHSNLVRQWESDDGELTPALTESERMSSPATYSDLGSVGKRNFSGFSAVTQRSRSGTVSSEGSWVPSSLSYCETWLQGAPPMEGTGDKSGKSNGFNRRKFQIVQKSPLIPDWKRGPNDVMFAVASKTKPKLVDISRQSSPAMSYSLPTPIHVLSDSGYVTHNPTYSPADPSRDKDDEYTDSSSVGSRSASDNVICDKVPPSTERPKPPSIPDIAPRVISSPTMQVSSGGSNKPDQEELEKWWDHEWTVDQLEHSVKDFPRNKLRLTSPVIMFLRHSHEKALMRPFRQIFPDSPENLLDSLCAVLIARNYVISLPSHSRRTINLPARSHFSKLDPVPEKASSILGMKYGQSSSSRIRDRVLGSRSDELRKHLDRIVEGLLFEICGPTNEALKSAVLVLIQVLEAKA
ncbi:hypothetical protein ARAM_000408 [Aspergillus rambellii]|uniref:Uncharacterized protein n=1 Tax=Aspergillus rambellii TaxID=308745 RepID=A0A0F8WYR1_9EURO|nr:hypothetical protein ARAM_000408 [Aspergillus rambellii]